MWATDWPWFDWAFKYEQGVNAIRKHADFLSEQEKAEAFGLGVLDFFPAPCHVRLLAERLQVLARAAGLPPRS